MWQSVWRSQGNESFPNMAGWPWDSGWRLASNQLHLAASWATPLKGRLEWSQVICLWFDEKNSGKKGQGGIERNHDLQNTRDSQPPLQGSNILRMQDLVPQWEQMIQLWKTSCRKAELFSFSESHRLWKETHYQTSRERVRERKNQNQTTGWLCILWLQTWARHMRSLQPSLRVRDRVSVFAAASSRHVTNSRDMPRGEKMEEWI